MFISIVLTNGKQAKKNSKQMQATRYHSQKASKSQAKGFNLMQLQKKLMQSTEICLHPHNRTSGKF